MRFIIVHAGIQKKMMKRALYIAALVFPFLSFAQSFEGSIYFTRSNLTDVVKYAYHVKGDMVRIDEYDQDMEKVIGTLLVDLSKEEMLALSHQRQLFMQRENRDYDPGFESALAVSSGNKREIMGMSCQQVRVKNEAADREIAYWVADGEFDFFPKLLKVLKRKDNFATYYMQIPDSGGKLPIHATERDLMRNTKGSLAIDRIEKQQLAADLFEVPKDYYKVDQ